MKRALEKKLRQLRERLVVQLDTNHTAILSPMDVLVSARLLKLLGIKAQVNIFDPWYNKGIGGQREDYIPYIVSILEQLKDISEHLFFWGFPEISARFVERIPAPLILRCWLTWYYKNSPSMIRGWRSAQMTCLHLSHPGAKLHVENFLNDIQLEKFRHGKLRYIPGPPSVIETSLLCGFVGKKEQTGHPSQKPIAAIDKLILMGTEPGELVIDLMSGAGTTAEAATINGRVSIICDHSEEYTQLAEKRLGVPRIIVDDELLAGLDRIESGLKEKPIRLSRQGAHQAGRFIANGQQLDLELPLMRVAGK